MRSLAALRAEVEPVDQAAYARFLADWQHLRPRTGRDGAWRPPATLEGVDGVATVLDQLAGTPLPASAWESLVLPARVRDYAPALLDELLATGEYVWSGVGEATGNDGWVALHPADAVDLTLRLPEPTEETPADAALRAAVLEVLAGGGAWFFPQLVERVRAVQAAAGDGGTGAAGGAVGPDPHRGPADLARGPAVLGALWGLVWDGRVGNDTFAPVRGLLSLGKTAHRTGRQMPRARTARTGGAAGAAAGRGLGGRLAGVRGRGRYAGLTSSEDGARGSAGLTAGTVGLSAAEQARSAGRWSLLPAAEQDPTIRAHATAELLLDRYGVITRGSVVAEEVPGGFAGQYRLLTRMEDAGQVRRGHFVDGLGGAQFSTGAVVDRLRGFQRDEEDAAVDAAPLALALAATDPANPYGAALDWPSVPAGPDGVVPTGHRPGRKAGAVVVLISGRLALYMERGGRTLLAFTEEPGELRAAAEALVWALRTGRTERLSLEKVNGGPVLGTPLAAALLAAGFYSSPSGIRFRN